MHFCLKLAIDNQSYVTKVMYGATNLKVRCATVFTVNAVSNLADLMSLAVQGFEYTVQRRNS